MTEYAWRPVRADDMEGLDALDRACLQADGPVSVPEPTYRSMLLAPGVAMRCAATERGDAPLAAVGWVRVNGTEARLGGKVHPADRRQGLGTEVLRWAEGQARTLGAPAEFIIRNEAVSAGSAALYTQEGYTCGFAEDWMQRDLSAPLPTLTQSFTHMPWKTANAEQFYTVYTEAFRTRPGFAPRCAADWIGDYVDDPDFRPDLSLLALVGKAPVGFLMAGVLPIPYTDQKVGWVSQVGTVPAWRSRGVAAGLIVAVLAAFQREGFAAVGLHVNVNNPGAIRVYDQLGFRFVNRRVKYTKNATPQTGPDTR